MRNTTAAEFRVFSGFRGSDRVSSVNRGLLSSELANPLISRLVSEFYLRAYILRSSTEGLTLFFHGTEFATPFFPP